MITFIFCLVAIIVWVLIYLHRRKEVRLNDRDRRYFKRMPKDNL